MKMWTITLLIISFQLSARTFSQNITLSFHNANLETIFRAIEQQTPYHFIYTSEELDKTSNVSIEVKSRAIEKVLDICFKDQPLAYRIEENYITVNLKETTKYADSAHIIKGIVLDEKGEPLPGAAILVKGSKKGTQTNGLGNFELKNVEDNAMLVISFTGYQSKIIELNGQTFVKVSLSLSSNPLDQVQVIAYGTVSKRLNTGDVTTVTGEDIGKQPVSDPIMALEGRVPGLYISQYSGIPGANEIVSLRGQNSIANGNNPFYVVDGVPFSSTSLSSTYFPTAVGDPGGTNIGQGLSPFNGIDPSDIESIEVLKDADATAIYGSRGANGVILITTKKGKIGKTKFDLNVFTGPGRVTRMLDLLNTQQYLEMRHEALNNDGLPPGSGDNDINGAWDTTRYTNWQKVMIGNSEQFTSAQANLSGGDINTQFLIGGGYSKRKHPTWAVLFLSIQRFKFVVFDI